MRLFERLVVYGNSAEVESIQDGYQAAMDQLSTDTEDVAAQLCVNTAADWGLKLWEAFLGIKTDSTMDEQTRREAIKAKLRGAGTTTVAMIENVAESYTNGEVDVTEDAPNYRFIITFTSQHGRPPGLESLKAAIEDIKPAHLAVSYVFTYTTHAELARMTHGALAAYTHEQIRVLEVI